MPKIRIGLSTDFNLVGEQIGIGKNNPSVRLDVNGNLLSNNISDSSGVSSISKYDGFLSPSLNLTGKTGVFSATDKGNLNSISGEILIEGEVTIAPDTSVTSGRLDSLTVTDKFAVPLGDTNNRDNTPEAGTTRFNQDFGTLEFFDGLNWKTVNSYARYHGGGAGRGVFMGGRQYPAPDTAGAAIANISYIQISTKGNAIDFGSLTDARESGACLGSSTRSIKGGGTDQSAGEEQNDIQYITTASLGNAIDFGDLNNRVRSHGAVSSSTRGLFAGGCVHPNTDTDSIDYIEMSTLGNAVDFGDHVAGRNIKGIESPVKAVFGGGNDSTTLRSINIASKGNTTFFGDVFQDTSGSGTVGNSTRGLFCGGYNISPTGSSVINYITFASDGNGTDFGEMNGLHQTASSGGMSNATKGVFGPGQSPFAGANNIAHYLDEITISTFGSATDFGDSGPHGNFNPKVSDSHGGLGGF